MEKINISSFKNGKETLVIESPPEKLDVQDVVKGKVKAELTIDRRNNIVEITGSIRYTLKLTCARCLEKFDKDMGKNIHLTLKRGSERIFREQELSNEDIDTVYIMNDVVDISSEIHDIILLSVPIKPLCKEDCKGLCPICGKNLNEGPCEHTIKTADSKKIFVKKLKGSKVRMNGNR